MEESKSNFPVKLWCILEDDSITDIICWDRTGKSFHILDIYKFCEVILPRFSKHKNMSSFVRQLNLYGFKKIATVDRSTLIYNDNLTEPMQFAHAFFRLGQPHLLKEIKRNQTAPKRQLKGAQAQSNIAQAMDFSSAEKMVTLPENDLINMIDEMDALRSNQVHLENTIRDLTRDNEMLWNEVVLLRDSHLKQQQNVGKLVQFLISLVQPASSNAQKHHGRVGPTKRIVPIVDEQSNPLAVASPHTEKPSWDVLACIQQDILSEALNYSSMSSLSSPQPSDEASLAPMASVNKQILRDTQPIIQTSGGGPARSFDKKDLSIISPRHQLSMHLTNPVPLSYSHLSNALVPSSGNARQVIRYQPPEPKPGRKRMHVTPLQRPNFVEHKSQAEVTNSQYGEEEIVVNEHGYEQYMYDEQPGTSTAFVDQPQSARHNYQPSSPFMEYMEEEDEFVQIPSGHTPSSRLNKVEVGGGCHSRFRRTSSPPAGNPYAETIEANRNHELILYDAMNSIVEHPWQIS